MNLTSRPLLATKRDQRLFAGRDWERETVTRGLQRGFNVVVEGEHGSGKTTLLRAVLWEQHAGTQSDTGEMVYVRASGLPNAAVVLTRVLDVLAGREASSGHLLTSGPGLRELADRRAVGPVCVLLDDVEPQAGSQLFGVLRDELWETGVQWVVTVNPGDGKTLRTPPADAFFEVALRLDSLSPDAAFELLARRMAFTMVDGRVEGSSTDTIRLLAEKGGQPRDLLERARYVEDNNDPAAVLAASRGIEDVLARVSRPAGMLYAEIRHRDPISASDKDVQNRMGWTRSRMIQVLGELEAAGVVESYRLPQEGPGAPKKMFRAISPLERRPVVVTEEA